MSQTDTQLAAAAGHAGLSWTLVKRGKQPAEGSLYSAPYGSKPTVEGFYIRL